MKNLITIIVFFISFLISFNNVYADRVVIDRDQAIDILIAQVINNSIYRDTLMAFGPQILLQEGIIVEPAHLNTPPYTGSTVKTQGPTWFFWVDEKPKSMFVHTCQFVYIDANNPNPTLENGIKVETQGWWPVINGVDYYRYYEERVVSPDMCYGTIFSAP